MMISQHPVIEWPAEFDQMIKGVQMAHGREGHRYCRIDLDVDRDTLRHLNEFQAHARHRRVRLRPAGSPHCLIGEMNPVIGLGAASDPARHIAKIRISFHDLQEDDCATVPHLPFGPGAAPIRGRLHGKQVRPAGFHGEPA
jgi:hypothetical protein